MIPLIPLGLKETKDVDFSVVLKVIQSSGPWTHCLKWKNKSCISLASGLRFSGPSVDFCRVTLSALSKPIQRTFCGSFMSLFLSLVTLRLLLCLRGWVRNLGWPSPRRPSRRGTMVDMVWNCKIVS